MNHQRTTNNQQPITNQSRNGFTLIEMLVSVGVIGILSIVITQTIANTARSNTKTELIKDAKQNGDFAIDVMSRVIRNSTGIVCSDMDIAVGSIMVENPDDSTTTFGCVVDSGVTRIVSTNTAPPPRTDYLTSGNVTTGGTDCTLSSLKFICTASGNETTNVKINFRLSQKNTAATSFEAGAAPFQTVVTSRN